MTARPTPADRYRRAELAKIHVAKKQLALDDDTYRALLERLTGQTSAADLTARQRDTVLKELTRLGFRAPAHRRPNPPTAKQSDQPTALPLTGSGWDKDRLFSKIGALLCTASPPRPWAYADGIARHMFQLDSIRFADPAQLHKIVAALEYDKKRRAKAAAPA